MGGLPNYLTDENVRKLCETFGSLKYFNLVKDISSGAPVSKGYCFFEYHDPSIADKAVKALNNLPCGDRRLKV
jgi:splicing factor U2AF subunit